MARPKIFETQEEYRKAYYDLPEVRAKQRLHRMKYKQKLEIKKKIREYNREYMRKYWKKNPEKYIEHIIYIIKHRNLNSSKPYL